MNYPQCTDCLCSTCSNQPCATQECNTCADLGAVFGESCTGYPNIICACYKPQPDPGTRCICCGAAVPFGNVYCPNCLVTQIRY